jgi:hypothetical protein
MMEEKKIESHEEGSLRLKCFSPLKILTSLLFEVTLGAFFLFSFSSFFYAPSLEDSGGFDDICGENHSFKNLFSNGKHGMAWS